LPVLSQIDVFDVLSVDENLATVGIIESFNKLDNRAFA
jgi:hypothetical protein